MPMASYHLEPIKIVVMNSEGQTYLKLNPRLVHILKNVCDARFLVLVASDAWHLSQSL